jgi:hypothetical protein
VSCRRRSFLAITESRRIVRATANRYEKLAAPDAQVAAAVGGAEEEDKFGQSPFKKVYCNSQMPRSREAVMKVVKPDSHNYVSILGTSLFEPIVTLLEKILAEKDRGASAVQTSGVEHGYCASACLLLAVMLESFVMRARYLAASKASEPPQRTWLEFLRKRYPEFSLLEEVREVMVLRDVIAHNHLWRIEYSDDDAASMKVLKKADLDPSCGDAKFEDVVDNKLRQTRRLGLNVVPTKIHRSDVSKVLETVCKALLELDRYEQYQLGLTPLTANFQGKYRSLKEIAGLFRQSCS